MKGFIDEWKSSRKQSKHSLKASDTAANDLLASSLLLNANVNLRVHKVIKLTPCFHKVSKHLPVPYPDPSTYHLVGPKSNQRRNKLQN